MSETTSRPRLGDTLLAKGLISESQLGTALAEQRRVHRPLGEILQSLGFVRPDQMAAVVADTLGIRVASVSELKPDPVLVAALDPAFVRAAGAFPLAIRDGVLQVAMCDPGDPEMVSLVRQHFPFPLDILMITSGDLTLLTRKFLSTQEALVTRLLAESSARRRAGDDDGLRIEELATAVIVDGVRRGATDVHVEPEEKVTRVRYRVDGLLIAGESLPREITDAVVSRIKIMSAMDIAERRRPQDGRMRLSVDGRDVDLRVSVMPVTSGENLVMRVLDRASGTVPLGALGFNGDVQRRLTRIASRPHGLFLVTGPTGSGKTTTLYSLLSRVDAIKRNVATVEDPVEYEMPLVRQSQIEPAAGYGFNDGLRALLRQDPDVILVGEIRDRETADMAIKASMTGHLVMSTLHTNSAIGAVARLADLGVPPYLVEDSLIGVLAQRLVRRVCGFCSQPYTPTASEVKWLEGRVGDPRLGAGCDQCGHSGLSGRTVISELFLPDDSMADILRTGSDGVVLRAAAMVAGFEDMIEDGRNKVRSGQTTVEEVLRVACSHRLSEADRG